MYMARNHLAESLLSPSDLLSRFTNVFLATTQVDNVKFWSFKGMKNDFVFLMIGTDVRDRRKL